MQDSTVELADRVKSGHHGEPRAAATDKSGPDRSVIPSLFQRGAAMEKAGDALGAAACYEEILAVDDNRPEALFRLGYLADLHGDDESAIEYYKRCTSCESAPVNAMINLAILYEDLGAYAQAEVLLEQVLDDYPEHSRARKFLKDVRSALIQEYDEDEQQRREKRNALLDTPITDFELSVRSRNCLKKMDIITLGDLLRTSEDDLLGYKNFGETSLNEIKNMLTQKGLKLGQLSDRQSASKQPTDLAAMLPQGADPGILSKPVSELDLSVRSRKCLQRLNIGTLGDLVAKSERELLGTKNFGQTSLLEIKQKLQEFGLGLRKSTD